MNVTEKQKWLLTWALGIEIDSRGGHAAGYVAVNGKVNIGKKLGKWAQAKPKFIYSAAGGDVAMLHARFATCGKRSVDEAHPFTVRRDGKTVLHGIHNGIIYNGFESAKKHGRKIRVDSEEIFELLADNDIAGINALDGYGVINYILPSDPHCVRVVRLSTSSDFHAVHIKGGGIVWGSTKRIVDAGLKVAGLEADGQYDLSEIGKVYEIRANDKIMSANTSEGIKFSEDAGFKFARYGSRSFGHWDDKFDADDFGSNWKNWDSTWDDVGIDEDPPQSNAADDDVPLMVECDNCKCEMSIDDYDQYMDEYRDIMGLPPDEEHDLILCDRCIWDYPKIARKVS